MNSSLAFSVHVFYGRKTPGGSEALQAVWRRFLCLLLRTLASQGTAEAAHLRAARRHVSRLRRQSSGVYGKTGVDSPQGCAQMLTRANEREDAF